MQTIFHVGKLAKNSVLFLFKMYFWIFKPSIILTRVLGVDKKNETTKK
jgi:hypothetical protein